ncbi:MAG: hypothetical protein ACK4RK_20695 [Gemmataceae bacterium]
MTDRENQHRLDRLALQYLVAVEMEDFDTIDSLWRQAGDDADLDAMLHGLNAELVAEQDAQKQAAIASAVLDSVERHMPSAEIVRPTTGPLTVAEVAEHIRRHPPAGLTTDDLRLNDVLRKAREEVPSELGISQVIRWGTRFGFAPEAYWRAFREVALDLWMERTSAANYQLAARPQRPKRPGDTK